jgi:hypothetical protein
METKTEHKHAESGQSPPTVNLESAIKAALFDWRTATSVQVKARQSSLERAAEVGRLLSQLKDTIEHGQWLPALLRLEIPPRRAQRFMRLAAKYDTVSYLPTAKQAEQALTVLVPEYHHRHYAENLKKVEAVDQALADEVREEKVTLRDAMERTRAERIRRGQTPKTAEVAPTDPETRMVMLDTRPEPTPPTTLRAMIEAGDERVSELLRERYQRILDAATESANDDHNVHREAWASAEVDLKEWSAAAREADNAIDRLTKLAKKILDAFPGRATLNATKSTHEPETLRALRERIEFFEHQRFGDLSMAEFAKGAFEITYGDHEGDFGNLAEFCEDQALVTKACAADGFRRWANRIRRHKGDRI